MYETAIFGSQKWLTEDNVLWFSHARILVLASPAADFSCTSNTSVHQALTGVPGVVSVFHRGHVTSCSSQTLRWVLLFASFSYSCNLGRTGCNSHPGRLSLQVSQESHYRPFQPPGPLTVTLSPTYWDSGRASFAVNSDWFKNRWDHSSKALGILLQHG